MKVFNSWSFVAALSPPPRAEATPSWPLGNREMTLTFGGSWASDASRICLGCWTPGATDLSPETPGRDKIWDAELTITWGRVWSVRFTNEPVWPTAAAALRPLTRDTRLLVATGTAVETLFARMLELTKLAMTESL
jgi:hypothetical protein